MSYQGDDEHVDTTNPSPNVGNIDLDELQKRFAELGDEGFDAENPPAEALQEIVRHVQLDDDQVALLFGEELGLTWAELRDAAPDVAADGYTR